MSVIKNNGPLLNPGLCRFCRAIKKCRTLTAEYTWNDNKEVYADMIMDCFGILLSHVEEGGVCAACVLSVRAALAFRAQLLAAETLFLQSRLHPPQDRELILKAEEESDSDRGGDGDGAMEADVDDGEYLPDGVDGVSKIFAGTKLKEEQVGVDPPLPVLPPAPEQTDFTQKEYDSYCSSDEPLSKKKRKKNGLKKKGDKKKKVKEVIKKKTPKKPPAQKNPDRDLDCMSEENLLTLVQNSYVCPFKNRRNNYYCFYCKDYFAKPEDLREHTLTHDTKPFQLLLGYKKMPKIDITRIDCRLCPAKIDDIDTFKRHISEVHKQHIYFEAPDKILCYKLTWNDLVCVLCSDVFEDFNNLNNHMVEHFSNFSCDMCGMCFLERARLDAHLRRHARAERHACDLCGKQFRSNHYKDMHVDIVHRKKAIIRCPRCDECFMSYALKNKHLTEAHGQRRTYPCHLCDKVYNRQKTLTEHQRRNHQKVLKHQCEYCEQRFYLPSRLKEHVATHTGERNFRCEYCDKSYPRLKSLQYHVRTHAQERTHRCGSCGQGFLQAQSLRAHIKAHHPDVEGGAACYY